VVLAAITVTATVLGFFAVDVLRNAPETFTAIVAIPLLSVVFDYLWKHGRDAQRRPGPSVTRGAATAPPTTG
jgi:hypothetical protein